jgi:hypothetical protein
MPEKRVHVTAVPTEVVPEHTDAVTARVKNVGANPADCGASDVAFGAGFTVAAGAEEPYDLAGGERLFAVCGAGLATDLEVSY